MQISSFTKNSSKINQGKAMSYMDQTASSSVKQIFKNTRQKSKTTSKRIKLNHIYSSRNMNTQNQTNLLNSQRHVPSTHTYMKNNNLPKYKTNQNTNPYKKSNENKNTSNQTKPYNKLNDSRHQNQKNDTSSCTNKNYHSNTQIKSSKNKQKNKIDIKSSNQNIKNVLHEKHMKEQNYPKTKKKKSKNFKNSNEMVNKTLHKMAKRAKKKLSKNMPFQNKVFYNHDNGLSYIDYRFSDHEDNPEDYKNLEWNTHNDPFDESFQDYSDEFTSSKNYTKNCNF